VIAEPVRSAPAAPPPGFWTEVRQACDDHGAVLIFDEIPTGLGKTGRLFSSAHAAVRPDITVLGKALGGGMLPLAAVIADRSFDLAPELALGHYTHEKNPLTTRRADDAGDHRGGRAGRACSGPGCPDPGTPVGNGPRLPPLGPRAASGC
jgi:4-aminobutyrate aminotransferase